MNAIVGWLLGTLGVVLTFVFSCVGVLVWMNHEAIVDFGKKQTVLIQSVDDLTTSNSAILAEQKKDTSERTKIKTTINMIHPEADL